MRFPWQIIIACNEYLHKFKGKLSSSKYIHIANSTAYEMCYVVPHARSYKLEDKSFMDQLHRAEVGIVIKPGKLLRILLETDSLARDKQIFDTFLKSLR